MLKHYLIASWRNLLRRKFYSVILVMGLAVGIASFIILMMYTTYELSYDDFHEHKERIFLVGVDAKEGKEENRSGWTTPPTGPALREFFPEIESVTRLCLWLEDVIVKRGEIQHAEDGILGADSTVFRVFTIPFVAGDPESALREPNSVVITESAAKKYFGEANPLSQTLQFDHFFHECKVTGVVKDYPDNSHFDFDILLSLSSFKTIGFDFATSWDNHTFSTYVLLDSKTSSTAVEQKFPQFLKEYFEPFLISKYKKPYKELYKNGDHYSLFLMPLKEVHLSTMVFENREGKKLLTFALLVIAFIILLLVCINYTNLATVLSTQRMREVGIRKASGSSGISLFRQFLVESILITFAGLIMGIVMVEVLLPYFNNITGKQLHIDYRNISSYAAVVAFGLVLGIASGCYPAWTFASFNPVKAIKGTVVMTSNGAWLRNSLVILQFTICVVMILSTIAIYRQLTYMTSKNLGFDKEHIVVLKRPWGLKDNKEAFKNELLKQSSIMNVSFANTTPGRSFDGHGQHFANTPEDELPTIFPLVGDKDILSTLSLEIVEGKTFEEYNTDAPKAILNESAVKALRLEKPLETFIDRGTLGKEQVQVIGIVKDFHFQSFHQAIQPLVIYNSGNMRNQNFILVKIRGDDIPSTLKHIEKTWKNLSNGYIFEYSFLDEDFSTLFQREQTMARVYTIFSSISIFIACIGLLGLASFFTAKRTREIGVRKIVGASMLDITLLISKQYVRWIIIAVLLGSGIGWYIVNWWLQHFAYQAPVTVWMFLTAPVMVFLIAFLTIGWHMIRTAAQNPIDSLRTE